MGKFEPAPTVAAGLVRLARSKSGLTQAELAERAGISQQTVSAYETGRMDPTVSTILKIVEAAGLELRFQLHPANDHDASLERYLDSIDPEIRAQLERHQTQRVDAARLKRVRGR